MLIILKYLGNDSVLFTILLLSRNHDHAKPAIIKENIHLGHAYSFRVLVHHHHVREHGWQAGRVVKEKHLRATF